MRIEKKEDDAIIYSPFLIMTTSKQIINYQAERKKRKKSESSIDYLYHIITTIQRTGVLIEAIL